MIVSEKPVRPTFITARAIYTIVFFIIRNIILVARKLKFYSD